MLLVFILSMPNVGSWNGKWSGENDYYARVKSFVSKIDKEKAQRILKEEYYHYNFGDGWSAGVTIKEVNRNEANKIRRKTKGFCGYEWMIKSIINHGEIKPND